MSAPRTAWVRQIMGLPVSIHLRGQGTQDARETAVAAAFAELERADQLFSTFKPGSQISRLNRGELATGRCDPLVQEVLALCEQAREATGGSFDAWRRRPDGTRFVDPSGLVKGWAAERAARLLTSADDDHYLNAGGDIALGSAAPLSPYWRIGIEDPSEPSRMIGVLALRSGAIATSGITRRGTHIIDPATGGPAERLLSATVTGPSLMWADVYATALIAGGSATPGWLAAKDGYEALAVTAGGEIHQTPGFCEVCELRPAITGYR
jgi:thiamine biosynthesis lipoprotein